MENNNRKTKTRKARVKLLKEQAYEIIKEGIITSFYKPGDELREASLSDEIGISKTPVREALIQLENEGFVEMRPFRGAIVTDISIEDVIKLYEFRQVIETYAIKVAAKNLDQNDIEYLKKQIKTMEHAYKNELANEYDLAHSNLHRLIILKTENKWISGTLSSMEDYMKRVRSSVLKNEATNFINDYEQLIEALEQKDADKACKVIEGHLNRVVEQYKHLKSISF